MKTILTFILLLATAITTNSCCSGIGHEIYEYNSNFKAKSNTFVFLNARQLSTPLRKAFNMKGLKVLRFSTVDTKTISMNQIRSFKEARAAYAIEITKAQYMGSCFNDSENRLLRLNIDIIDIHSNEVVFSLEATSGEKECWPCGNRSIYDVIAEEVNKFWIAHK